MLEVHLPDISHGHSISDDDINPRAWSRGSPRLKESPLRSARGREAAALLWNRRRPRSRGRSHAASSLPSAWARARPPSARTRRPVTRRRAARASLTPRSRSAALAGAFGGFRGSTQRGFGSAGAGAGAAGATGWAIVDGPGSSTRPTPDAASAPTVNASSRARALAKSDTREHLRRFAMDVATDFSDLSPPLSRGTPPVAADASVCAITPCLRVLLLCVYKTMRFARCAGAPQSSRQRRLSRGSVGPLQKRLNYFLSVIVGAQRFVLT